MSPSPMNSPLHSQLALPLAAAAVFLIALPAVSQSFTSPPPKPTAHITVPENTVIRVRTDQPINTKRSRDGMPILFTLSQDVIVNSVVLIPRGAAIHGEVVRSKKAAVLGGTPQLILKLDSLDLGGQSYPLYSYQFRVTGETKDKPAVDDIVGAAAYGALAGVVIADTKPAFTGSTIATDAGAGAAIGAAAVVAATALTPKPIIKIPAESQLDFYLAAPMSIQPVSEREAARLAQRLNPAGPVLFVHGDTP